MFFILHTYFTASNLSIALEFLKRQPLVIFFKDLELSFAQSISSQLLDLKCFKF
jgi:hypothetical protein